MLPPFVDLSSRRLVRYDENEQLLENEAFSVFDMSRADYYKEMKDLFGELGYIQVNFFELVSEVYADMVVGEGVMMNVTPSGERETKYIANWTKRNNFLQKVYEGVYFGATFGDTVFKVRIGQYHGKPDVTFDRVDPRIWFPNFAQGAYGQEASEHWLLVGKKTVNKFEHLLFEVHTATTVEFRAYSKREGQDDKTFQKTKPTDQFGDIVKPYKDTNYIITHNLGYPLVFHVKNKTVSRDHFGGNDYDSLKSLVFGYNQGLTRNEIMLNKTADPFLVLPQGTLEGLSQDTNQLRQRALQTDTFNSVSNPALHDATNTRQGEPGFSSTSIDQVLWRNHNIFKAIARAKVTELGSNGQRPEWIAYQGNIQSQIEQSEKLFTSILIVSRISPHLVYKETGAVLSGRALKLLAEPTLKRAQKKARLLVPVLERMLQTIFTLAKDLEGDFKFTGGALEDVQVTLKDGLVDDELEVIDIEQKKLEAGLTTTVKALQRTHDMEENQAKKLATTIKEEQAEKFKEMQALNPQLAVVEKGGENA